ncbi:MAG: hypothetical protein RLY61_784 [Candidatus Parcubacteria bacterium]
MKNYYELNSHEKRNYNSLLNTFEWNEIRSKLFKKEKFTCKFCSQKANWEIHVGGHYGYQYRDVVEGTDEFGLPSLDLKWMKQENPLILHLHHTYYVRYTLPWDYPDECFQVLCKACHENEHKNKVFRMYASHELGQSQHLTPCEKCKGSGYLPHYHYYEDGVCFGCNGAGFEELKSDYSNIIFNNENNLSSSTDEIDDLPF